MMKDLVRILRDSELDRETKLKIIEIVSISQEDDLVKDLVDVLKEWDMADNRTEQDFAVSMSAIADKYKNTLEALDDEVEHKLEVLEEEVQKQDHVGEIKKTILE